MRETLGMTMTFALVGMMMGCSSVGSPQSVAGRENQHDAAMAVTRYLRLAAEGREGAHRSYSENILQHTWRDESRTRLLIRSYEAQAPDRISARIVSVEPDPWYRDRVVVYAEYSSATGSRRREQFGMVLEDTGWYIETIHGSDGTVLVAAIDVESGVAGSSSRQDR